MAAQVVKRGGTIVCAAECSDGLPNHGEYGKLLTEADGPESLLEMIRTPGMNRHDQWQVQIQAQIQLMANVFVKSKFLSDDEVRSAHLQPVYDIEGLVVSELKRLGNLRWLRSSQI